MMITIPAVIEERKQNVTTLDIFSRLLNDRIVFIGQEIDNDLASRVQAQLLYLDACDPKAPIKLYINSPGGCVDSGYGIYDTIKTISAPVYTVCTGMAASMAAVLLAAGENGHRKALPHSRIMIHQPSGGAWGQSADVEIAAKELVLAKQELAKSISEDTGTAYKTVLKDIDRDNWMSVEQAIKYGLVDEVVSKKNFDQED